MLREFNAFHNIAPTDELLLMRELKIPTHGSNAEVILELQGKLETLRQDLQRAEGETRLQERKVAKLEAQLSHKGKTIATLQQENAGLMNQLHNEREASEQDRLLMEKRISLLSGRRNAENAQEAAQGRKNDMRGRMAQTRC